MNIIITQVDLDKGLSPKGTYTKKQAELFNSTWNKDSGFDPSPLMKRCRAELMQKFIDIRSTKKE